MDGGFERGREMSMYKATVFQRNQIPFFIHCYLLPSGSEQHEVLQVGSIQEGILQVHH